MRPISSARCFEGPLQSQKWRVMMHTSVWFKHCIPLGDTDGRGPAPNAEGVAHYNRLINGLLAKGMLDIIAQPV